MPQPQSPRDTEAMLRGFFFSPSNFLESGSGFAIPAELAGRLRRALAMRSIIIHGYLRIALELVHTAIRDTLGDIEEFCRHVLTCLEGTT